MIYRPHARNSEKSRLRACASADATRPYIPLPAVLLVALSLSILSSCGHKPQAVADSYRATTTPVVVATTALVIEQPPTTTTTVVANLAETPTSVPSDEAVLLASYTFGQRGQNVVLLQTILGLTADGWYWTQTRTVHLEHLARLLLPTNGVPAESRVETGGAEAPSQSSQDTCRAHALSFVTDRLSILGVPAPQLVFDETIRVPYYRVGQGVVVAKSCSSDTSLAHELGHYVLDLANDYNWTAHAGEAAANFSNGGWIKGAEASPGVEYAAHCVGWVLYGEGTYTRCPNDAMREYARSVLRRASN